MLVPAFMAWMKSIRSHRSDACNWSSKAVITRPPSGSSMACSIHQNSSPSICIQTCGAVRSAGWIGRLDAAGPSPRPPAPWQGAQFSANRRCPWTMEAAANPVGELKKLVGYAGTSSSAKDDRRVTISPAANSTATTTPRRQIRQATTAAMPAAADSAAVVSSYCRPGSCKASRLKRHENGQAGSWWSPGTLDAMKPAAPMMISPSTASPPIEWRKARRAAPGLGPSTRPVSTRRLRAARVSASRNSASFSSAAWPYAVPTSDGTLPIKASPCGTAVAAIVATAAMPTWENRPSIAVRVFGPSSERLSRSGSRPPSHTPDAIRCRASEVTSQTASMPPAAPAWPIQPCKASAAPVSTAAATLRPPCKDSSGSAAASKASRTSADWPNRVCSATTGTAEARSARVWEPAIAAACATSQQTPDSKANTPLNRLSRSSRRCKAPVADGSMFSAAGRTEALNTVTPSSDSIAAICRLRKPVSRTSNQLMSRGDGKHELPFRLVRIHRGHVPDDGVFAGRQLAQPHDKLPAVLLCMHVTRIHPFVRGVAHLDLTEARLHRFGEGDGDGRGRVRHLAADRGDGTVEEGVREGGRTHQHQHDGRNEQALHRSPPFHDRLAEAVRQQIVKVEMELRDHPDMRTGLLVAGDQRLDAERIG